MKYLWTIIFLVLFVATVQAQVPSCSLVSLKAVPPGPFPCSITAVWTDTPNEDGYVLERSLNNGPWVAFPNIASGITSFIDDTLTQSQSIDNVYKYQIKAFNKTGSSPYTVQSALTIITIPKVVPIPPTPSGFTITFDNGTGQFRVTGGHGTVNFKNEQGTFILDGIGITIVER